AHHVDQQQLSRKIAWNRYRPGIAAEQLSDWKRIAGSTRDPVVCHHLVRYSLLERPLMLETCGISVTPSALENTKYLTRDQVVRILECINHVAPSEHPDELHHDRYYE